ncbi:MAG: hypothetical protein U1F44_01115 [Coriobacteriia bacterium]|nr:hypothetical protein [Coriobacteriia bacterium]
MTAPVSSTTAWPTCRVPLPQDLCRWPDVALEEHEESAYLRRLGPSEVLERSESAGTDQLEPEFYLWELQDLDLDEPTAITEFVSRFGPLTSKRMGRKFMAAETVYGMLRDLIGKKKGVGSEDVLPLEEFRLAARTLRDATRGLLANAGMLSVEDMASAWETKRPFGAADGETLELAAAWAIDVINAGLTPFAPRLAPCKAPGADEAGRTRCSELYNVICLEIFNDVAGGSTFRTCEKCGRVFVRQRGRAVYGQHKREAHLRYCSKKCANAAAQAAHRAKVAKAKGREG